MGSEALSNDDVTSSTVVDVSGTLVDTVVDVRDDVVCVVNSAERLRCSDDTVCGVVVALLDCSELLDDDSDVELTVWSPNVVEEEVTSTVIFADAVVVDCVTSSLVVVPRDAVTSVEVRCGVVVELDDEWTSDVTVSLPLVFALLTDNRQLESHGQSLIYAINTTDIRYNLASRS